MVMDAAAQPLQEREIELPEPGSGEIEITVEACGVCRTDLHILDGDLTAPRLPLILGHEIVGRVVRIGVNATRFTMGQRVGVPWLGGTCGTCHFCSAGSENLCDEPTFTGYDRHGGFAERAIASEQYCFTLPEDLSAEQLAPLLCAGLIGYRSYRKAGPAPTLGMYGFGAAAHILCQLAVAEGRKVFAFTRPGDRTGQRFARELGALWAGASDESPPEPMDAAIIFAPVGTLVPVALRAVRKGGRVVCAGIHMTPIPEFDYADLWGERSVLSVANLTRSDGEEFFDEVRRQPLETRVTTIPLAHANDALTNLRSGNVSGAIVLVP